MNSRNFLLTLLHLRNRSLCLVYRGQLWKCKQNKNLEDKFKGKNIIVKLYIIKKLQKPLVIEKNGLR
jgi:hypothetical protein